MTPRKIMLLGDIGVGKSSIARRLVFDDFDGGLQADARRRRLQLRNRDAETRPAAAHSSSSGIRTETSATASCRSSTSREAAAALIVGDRDAAATLRRWSQLGRSFMAGDARTLLQLLMNKIDLTGAPTICRPSLTQSSVPTLRTSAKTGENVKHAFLGAADAIRRRGL